MFKTDILHALLSLLQVNGGRLKQKNTTLIALYLTSLLMPPNHEEDKDHSIGHSYDDDDDDDDDKIAIIFPTITLFLERQKHVRVLYHLVQNGSNSE